MSFGGIPVPELALLALLDDTPGSGGLIDQLVSNTELLDHLLQTVTPADQDSLRTALTRRGGRLSLGFGEESIEDWSVLVFKVGEAAPDRTLGDHVGAAEETPTVDPTTLAAAIGPEVGVALALVGGLPAGLPNRGRVRLGSTELATYRIDAGTVVLEARGVAQTTAKAHAIGAGVAPHLLSTRIGWSEIAHTRVDVLSSSALFNIFLATLIKATLISRAADFEAAGFTLRSITESDLAPRPESYPAQLYVRSLMVDLQRDFAVPITFPVVTGPALAEVTLTPEVP